MKRNNDGSFTFNFDFGNVDSHGDVFMKGCFDKSIHKDFNPGFANPHNIHFFDVISRARHNKLYKAFDVSDAIVIDEPAPNTAEYWQYQYERLAKLQSIIRDEVAQHGFDNQYVKDMQFNAVKLIDKLKNHEAQKSNS